MQASTAPAVAPADGADAKLSKKDRRAARVAERGPADGAPAAGPNGAGAGAQEGKPRSGGKPEGQSNAAPKQKQEKAAPKANAGAPAPQKAAPPRAGGGAAAGGASASAAASAGPPAVAGFSHLLHHPQDRGLKLDSVASLHPSFRGAAASFSSSSPSSSSPGTNERTIAVLAAVSAYVEAFVAPERSALARALDKSLAAQLEALRSVVQLGPAQISALNSIRTFVAKLSPALPDADAKAAVLAAVAAFRQQRVLVQEDVASACASVAGLRGASTVILYGRSSAAESLVRRIAKERAEASGAKLEVVVVDARPHSVGADTASRLSAAGLHVAVATPSGAAFRMRSASSSSSSSSGSVAVLCGASGVFGDGAVLGLAGQALLALQAKECGVPVYVAAETYKFADRFVSDSVAVNELLPQACLLQRDGGASAEAAPAPAPAPAATTPAAGGGKKKEGAPEVPVAFEDSASFGSAAPVSPLKAVVAEPKSLVRLLPLAFDVTPASLVAGFCTEIGYVPAASVAALLRAQAEEDEEEEEEEGSDEEDDEESDEGGA
jgi:translation initiation factor 2B subunit (eIF-2B alpha/beta/delta family)